MSGMDSQLESRLEELESRLAFQDDAIETLNNVIASQDREIVLLKRRLKELELKLRDFADSAPAGAVVSDHEVPPHY